MRLTTRDVARMRELRYGDGLSCVQVAAIIGCHRKTVGRYAPGRPGKVPNDRLRAVFEASSLSAPEVARRLGWFCTVGSGSLCADGARVKRALGLLPDISGATGRESTRCLIDAETAALMAEAIGVMPWEVMPDDEEMAA